MEGDLTYQIVLTSFLMPLLVSGFFIWFIIKYQKKKREYELIQKDHVINEQQRLIARQLALEEERNRIAAEMHDDLGGGLTSISFLSQKALKNIKDPNQKTELSRIVHHSQTLVNNMSEIIWAMNSGFDSIENLLSYIRRYASEYLSEHQINLEFKRDEFDIDIKISGEKRRNIFLIVKEVLHNVVKHSSADKVNIHIIIDKKLIILIKDNGMGIKKENKNGNGIHNIKKRIKKLNGKVNIENQDGTAFTLTLPI